MLFVACVAGVAGAMYWVAHGHEGFAFVLATLSLFAIFTPLHDGVHQSVSKIRWLNELVGRLSGIFLFAAFETFRWVHLEHHKHTNEPGADPDLWSGRGPWWALPFRWATQDLHYIVLEHRAGRTLGQRLPLFVTYGGIFVAIAVLTAMGYGRILLFAWILPARVAITLLAFAFDYLPHRPHAVLQRDNRYLATSVMPSRALGVVLLYQNYHLIHHLYPAVPFYRYERVWEGKREFFEQQGVRIERLI